MISGVLYICTDHKAKKTFRSDANLKKKNTRKNDPLSETRNLRGLKDNTISFDRWEWGEGLFDCSWSEHNQDFSITASGDGSIQMWDLKNPKVNFGS